MKTNKKNGMVINGLNHRQRLFVAKYIELKGNATQAAIEAGYGDNYDTSASIGSKLLKNIKVSRAIDIAMKKQGVGDIGKYIEDKLTTITEAGTTDVALKQAKVTDAISSLQLLTKLKGIADNSKQNISLHKHYHGMTKQELLEEKNKLDSFYAEVDHPDSP